MNKLIILLVAGSLAACDMPPAGSNIVHSTNKAWETAPTDYTCTKEEIQRVESEANYCRVSTSYFSSYCYGSAIMRVCKEIESLSK